jgi:hypothetical protein
VTPGGDPVSASLSISEPVARAAAERALTAEANSPNASIRSTAQLVEGLAGVVLGSTDPNGPAVP